MKRGWKRKFSHGSRWRTKWGHGLRRQIIFIWLAVVWAVTRVYMRRWACYIAESAWFAHANINLSYHDQYRF